jgi:hypothetical protein
MPDIEMTVSGTYTYDASSEIVTVVYRGRKKSTQLGGSTPEAIARLLLRELVDNPEGPGTSKA